VISPQDDREYIRGYLSGCQTWNEQFIENIYLLFNE